MKDDLLKLAERVGALPVLAIWALDFWANQRIARSLRRRIKSARC